MAYEVAQKGGTGGNGRADPGNGKPDSPDLADRVKAWAGLLLAAFLAAVNLIGLNNGEIPNILRNNIVAADVTGLLIVAAAVTAVIGALLPASRHLPVLWLAPIALAVAAVVLLPEVFIQIPTTGDYSENFAFWSGGLGIAAFITLVVVAYRYGLKHRHSALRLAPGVLAAGALACFAAFLYQAFAKSYLTDYWIWSVIFLAAALIAAGIYRYRDHLGSSPESDVASSSGGPGGAGAATTTDDRPKADPPAPGDRPAARPGERAGSPRSVFSVDGRSVLLVVAVALTAVATFAALRAETRSQDQSAAPKLDSTLTLAKPGADGTYDLTVKASATHLPGSNIVEITVYGLPYPGSHSPRNVTVTARDPSPCTTKNWCHPYRCRIHGCRVIANSFYGPDAQGSLNAKLNVIFREKSYSHIRIVARRFSPVSPCTKGRGSECYTVTSLVISPN